MRKSSFLIIFLLAAPSWLNAQATVPMSQYDYERTGTNHQESLLNPSNVGPGTFGKLFSRKVDANVNAQPLIIPNLEIDDERHNVMYVVTSRNTVYAFNADNPSQSRPLWKKSLGTPASGSGILGSPFIDVESGTLYAVAMIRGRSEVNLWVNAIDIYNGELKYNSPQLLSFPFAGPEGTLTNVPYALQRPGLLVVDNVLYVAFGNIVPDPNDSHWSQEGFVQSFDATDLSRRLGNYQATPSGRKGGIWQAARGIAADELGNIYLSTAGGSYDGVANFGSSVLKLAGPDLSIADWYTPGNHEFLFTQNIDISAGGVTLIPNTELLFAGGKEGVIYVLNRNDMGNLETEDSSPIQQFRASDGCGRRDCSQTLGTAFWHRDSAGSLFVWDKMDVLRAYDFIDNRFITTPTTTSQIKPGMNGGPSVSANGSDLSSGLVWAVTTESTSNFGSSAPATLRAFRAADVSQEVYNSDSNAKRDALGNFTKFAQPVIANGKVYVPSRTQSVSVYGLLCGADISPIIHADVSEPVERRRNRYTQSITVTNVSEQPIGAPFDIALENLTSEARLTNATGEKSCEGQAASPLIRATDAPLWLAPNESFTVSLSFRSRTTEISFDARVLSGYPAR